MPKGSKKSLRHPEWLEQIPHNLRPTAAKTRQLEEVRRRYNIPEETFCMRIMSSPVTTRRAQKNVYAQAKKMRPEATEKEILKAVLLGRCRVPFGFGLEMTETEVDNAMKNIDSLDDLIGFLFTEEKPLYDAQDDVLGIGKQIDEILSR